MFVTATSLKALLGAASALFVVSTPQVAAEGVRSHRAMPELVDSSSALELQFDNETLSTDTVEKDEEIPQEVLDSLLGRGDSPFVLDEPKPESIINGVATGGPVSHQVALAYGDYGLYCGGSLIHPRVALTAAHCIYSGNTYIPKYIRPRVQFNMYSLYNMAGVGDIYVNSVDEGVDIVVHEDYDVYGFDNDIALLILPFEVGGPNTQYAQINEDPNIPAANEALDVTGWGRTHHNTNYVSEVLLKTTLDYVTNDQCKNMWQGGDWITDGMMCARRDGTSICNGDSGGPLVLADTTIQVGIVSWAVRDCYSFLPQGFTRVSSYSGWIKESVCSRIGEFCQPPKQGSSKSRKSKSSKSFSISRKSKSSKKALSFSS